MRTDLESGNPLNDEKPEAQLNARRRLLRGSFAAPSVLALSSGSALAASSSLRCFNNAPTGVDNPPSNYFAVQRYASGTTKVVLGADITSLGILKGFATSAYVGSKVYINVSDGSAFTPPGTPPVLPTPDTGSFVALRFTNIGSDDSPNFSVSGLAQSSAVGNGPGKVMTGSCWSSFRPAPAPAP